MINDINERLAILKNLNTNYLVEANAGSGKTSLLVARMVSLVESGVPINQIVTITFTKKAANEFYERFYALLDARSKAEYIKIKDDCLIAPPTNEAKKHNLDALKEIDSCFMGTIDAFCNTLLLEHPIEGKVSSSAQIIEEKYLTPYINDFLSNVLKGKYGINIQQVARYISALYSRSNIVAMSLHALNNRVYDFVYDAPNSVNYQNEFAKFNNQLELLKCALKFIARLPDSLFAKSFDKTSRHLATYRYIHNEIDNILLLKPDELVKIKRLIKKIDGFLINLKTKLNYELIEKEGLTPLLIKNSRSVKLDVQALKDSLNYLCYCHALEFMSLIKDLLSQYLHDKGLLNFTDNLLDVYAMLADKENGPRLLKQIQNKHKYYLIDEFQDTSLLQVKLFLRLTATDYVKDVSTIKLLPGALFMVGDPKQSIYHFRGADITSYLAVKKLIVDHHLGEVIVLTENFRSNKTLCDYFDYTFKENFFGNNIGYKEINSSKEVTFDIHDIMTYQTSKEDDAINVANLIQNLIDDKNKTIKGRRLTYKDFMIILLNKKDIPSYRFALLKLGIPSFVEGKIDFVDSPLVSSLIAIFNYLTHRDNFSAYQVLASPLFSDIDVSKILKSYDDNAISTLNAIFTKWPEINEQTMPSTVIKMLLESKTLYSYVGSFGLDNAIALLNLIIEEENKGNIISFDSACRFLACCLNSDIERIAPLNYQNDVVHIANLHKLKGLEANIVILAHSSKKDKEIINTHIDEESKKEYLFLLKDYNGDYGAPILNYVDPRARQFVDIETQYADEEYKRLLYVAATRPANALYVSVLKDDSGNSYWTPLIKEIKEQFIIAPCTHVTINKKVAATDLIDEACLIKNQKNCDYPASYSSLLPSKMTALSKYYVEEETPHIKTNNDATAIGTMVHVLMENIIKAKNKRLTINICKSIANEYGYLKYQTLLEEVYETIYHGGYPQTSGVPNDIYRYALNFEALTEVPFAYYDEQNLITGSIDLLLKNNDEVIVIDYKTDRNVNTDHTLQLDAYIKAIKKTTGLKAKAYIYNIQIK